MKYNFDDPVNRIGTDSVKWGALGKQFGNENAIPMWVADMDFKSPQPIIDALTERATHGVFGYGAFATAFVDAAVAWFRTRQQWEVPAEAITFSPGVLAGLSYLITLHSQVGDEIMIQTPVYHPFARDIENLQRTVSVNALKMGDNGIYQMDFDDLRQRAKTAKMMVLCSPHNPIGRVWTPAELTEVAQICAENDVFVVADEIHADLILPGHRQTPFLSVPFVNPAMSAALLAPSKTFNIAGLHSSIAVILDETVRDSFKQALAHSHIGNADLFAAVAMKTAYESGAEWLDQLLPYLQGNADYVLSFLGERLPGIRAARPEGTYLMWLDCRGLGLSDDELEVFMNQTAGVAINMGKMFGAGGSGFIRLNIGCPRAQVKNALERFEVAAKTLQR